MLGAGSCHLLVKFVLHVRQTAGDGAGAERHGKQVTHGRPLAP